MPDLLALKDTKLSVWAHSWDYGAAYSTSLIPETPNDPWDRHLFQFDLSPLNPLLTVTSAILRIPVLQASGNTASTATAYRMLTAWYEGNQAGGPPNAGIDASTYDYKNANGSIAWGGGAGGGFGVDWNEEETGFGGATIAGDHFEIDVTDDVAAMLEGSIQNYGWMVYGQHDQWWVGKTVGQRHSGTAEQQPMLRVTQGAALPSLRLVPDTIYSILHDVLITAHCDTANWTPGDPDSVEFSVDHGTILMPEVLSPTVAAFWYRSSGYTGTAVISEATSNTQANLTVQDGSALTDIELLILGILSGLPDLLLLILQYLLAGGSGGCDLTEIERRLGNPPEGDSIWATEVEIYNWLDSLQATLLGQNQNPPSLGDSIRTAASEATEAHSAIDAAVAGTNHTLDAVVSAVNTHTDTELGELETTLGNAHTAIAGDVTAIKNSLSEVRTDQLYTLGTIYNQNAYTQGTLFPIVNAGILGIRGKDNNDLADVMAAIAGLDALQLDDLSGLIADVGTIKTDEQAAFPAIDGKLDDILGDPATSIQQTKAAVDALAGSVGTNELTVHQKLDALATAIAGIRSGIPCFPGDALVTWGDPIDFNEDTPMVIHFDQPCAGVRIHITDYSGSRRVWRTPNLVGLGSIGWITFEATTGYYERFQSIPFDKSIILPIATCAPIGFLLYCKGGTIGTVQPYTLTVS